MITVSGTFKRSLDYFRFLGSLNESELSQPQHHVKHPEMDYLGKNIKIKIHFEDHTDFLVKSSFKDGLLSPWKNHFKFSNPMETVVEKYLR